MEKSRETESFPGFTDLLADLNSVSSTSFLEAIVSHNSRDKEMCGFDVVIKCLERVVRRDKSRLLYLRSVSIALLSVLGSGCNQRRTGSSSPQPSQTTTEKLPATSLVLALRGQPLPIPAGCELMVKPMAAMTCSISLFQSQFQHRYIYLYLQGSVNGREKKT